MIYVYFGQDYGQVVHNCFKDLEKISKDVEIVKFDGFNNYIQDIISECTSYSLFDQKKIIVFEHAYFLTSTKVKSTISESKQNYRALQDFITSSEGYDLILLVPGLLDAKNIVVSLLKDNNCILNEAKSMTKEDYIEYGIKIAKENNKEISKEAVSIIYDRTKRKINYKDEGDFFHFTNELNKVLEYKNNIDTSDIEKLVIKPLEDDIFQTVTELLSKNINSAVSSYIQLRLLGYEVLNLLPIFVSQFNFYSQLKCLIELHKTDTQIMDELNISKGRLYYSKKSCSLLSFKTFIEILDKLGEIEKGIKLYTDDPDTVLLQFLLTFNLNYKR